MIGEFLRKIAAALEMHGVPYMLTGSLASSMYGVPRATNDVDIVVAPTRAQLSSVVQMFIRLGFTVAPHAAEEALRAKSQFNVIDFKTGWKVDLIVRKDRDFSAEEFGRRKTYEVEGMRLTVATPEDVLLSKLEWAKIGGSDRQINDAAGILVIQREKLDIEYVERWVTQLGLQEQWAAAQSKAV